MTHDFSHVEFEMLDQIVEGGMSLQVVVEVLGNVNYARGVLERYVSRKLIEIRNADGHVEPHWRMREILRDGDLGSFHVDMTDLGVKEFNALESGIPNALEQPSGDR